MFFWPKILGRALVKLKKRATIQSMSAEEFYNKIMASTELQQALEAATDSGSLGSFLSSNGCTASEDEFTEYVSAHS